MKQLGYLAFLSVLLFSGEVSADWRTDPVAIEFTATLPTTRADHTEANPSPFDPLTELESISVGCGTSPTGPFDEWVTVFTGPFVLPNSVWEQFPPENKDRYCVALAVDTDGRVSAPSNVAEYDFKAPPWAVLLEMTDVINRGPVNFNFIIQAQ